MKKILRDKNYAYILMMAPFVNRSRTTSLDDSHMRSSTTFSFPYRPSSRLVVVTLRGIKSPLYWVSSLVDKNPAPRHSKIKHDQKQHHTCTVNAQKIVWRSKSCRSVRDHTDKLSQGVSNARPSWLLKIPLANTVFLIYSIPARITTYTTDHRGGGASDAARANQLIKCELPLWNSWIIRAHLWVSWARAF